MCVNSVHNDFIFDLLEESHTKEILRKQLINSLGLEKYKKIVRDLKCTDLTSDDENAKEYRKTFNSFYRVRRNSDWQRKYYALFQTSKNEKVITFRGILDTLKKETGKLEPSFPAKCLQQ